MLRHQRLPFVSTCLARLIATTSETLADISSAIASLETKITPQVAKSLQQDGYAVIDNVFGSRSICTALRNEIIALQPVMHSNNTFLVQKDGTRLVSKKSIYESELMSPETQRLAPLCAQLQLDSTLRVLLNIHMPHLDSGLVSQAIKLQYNAGDGGCFPIHTDTDYGIDSRKITAIWYLNPDWQQGDGGELRLYSKNVVDIAPLNDRMVLFSSLDMPHRVLPSFKPRYCFTIWLSAKQGYDGDVTAADKAFIRQALSSETLDKDTADKVLNNPAVKRHAIKWRYREEWKQSIIDSHPSSAHRDQMVDDFERELDVLEKALKPLLPFIE